MDKIVQTVIYRRGVTIKGECWLVTKFKANPEYKRFTVEADVSRMAVLAMLGRTGWYIQRLPNAQATA